MKYKIKYISIAFFALSVFCYSQNLPFIIYGNVENIVKEFIDLNKDALNYVPSDYLRRGDPYKLALDSNRYDIAKSLLEHNVRYNGDQLYNYYMHANDFNAIMFLLSNKFKFDSNSIYFYEYLNVNELEVLNSLLNSNWNIDDNYFYKNSALENQDLYLNAEFKLNLCYIDSFLYRNIKIRPVNVNQINYTLGNSTLKTYTLYDFVLEKTGNINLIPEKWKAESAIDVLKRSFNEIFKNEKYKIICGRVKEDSVNLRTEPTTTSKIIKVLLKDTKVILLKNSAPRIVLSFEKGDTWYNVITDDGSVGWIFGLLIDKEYDTSFSYDISIVNQIINGKYDNAYKSFKNKLSFPQSIYHYAFMLDNKEFLKYLINANVSDSYEVMDREETTIVNYLVRKNDKEGLKELLKLGYKLKTDKDLNISSSFDQDWEILSILKKKLLSISDLLYFKYDFSQEIVRWLNNKTDSSWSEMTSPINILAETEDEPTLIKYINILRKNINCLTISKDRYFRRGLDVSIHIKSLLDIINDKKYNTLRDMLKQFGAKTVEEIILESLEKNKIPSMQLVKSIITEDNVRLRENATVNSNVLRLLSKNEIVYIYDTSKDTLIPSDKESSINEPNFGRWYKVITEDYKIGWVWCDFIITADT